MPLRKHYLLVSSDDRVIESQTTTDFICLLPVPIENVVKTDLVSVSADYRIANIISPNNTFTFNFYDFPTAAVRSEVLVIPESQYNAGELLAAMINVMEAALGSVGTSDVIGRLIGNVLQFDLLFPSATTTSTERTFSISSTNATVRRLLGMTSTTRSGVFTAALGANGGSRLTMNTGVQLPGLFPYILIQSTALGNDTRTVSGLTFWRALVNNATNPQLEIANNRTDEYVDEPRRLYQVDVRLIFPNGELIDNRGGVFAFIVEVVVEEPQSFKEKDEETKKLQEESPMLPAPENMSEVVVLEEEHC